MNLVLRVSSVNSIYYIELIIARNEEIGKKYHGICFHFTNFIK